MKLSVTSQYRTAALEAVGAMVMVATAEGVMEAEGQVREASVREAVRVEAGGPAGSGLEEQGGNVAAELQVEVALEEAVMVVQEAEGVGDTAARVCVVVVAQAAAVVGVGGDMVVARSVVTVAVKEQAGWVAGVQEGRGVKDWRVQLVEAAVGLAVTEAAAGTELARTERGRRICSFGLCCPRCTPAHRRDRCQGLSSASQSSRARTRQHRLGRWFHPWGKPEAAVVRVEEVSGRAVQAGETEVEAATEAH